MRPPPRPRHPALGRRAEERLLERLGAVALLQLVRRLERQQPTLVQDPDPLSERLGLVEVVRAEQHGRVVLGTHVADERLHLELRARVETRGRLVEQQQHRGGQERPCERNLLLHPSAEIFHRLAGTADREPDPLEYLRDPRARYPRRHPVEPRRVREVLERRHALEERRLDRHPVDQPPDRRGLAHHVVAEHPRVTVLREQERRQDPDESRLT
jgi:hypothetical protein